MMFWDDSSWSTIYVDDVNIFRVFVNKLYKQNTGFWQTPDGRLDLKFTPDDEELFIKLQTQDMYTCHSVRIGAQGFQNFTGALYRYYRHLATGVHMPIAINITEEDRRASAGQPGQQNTPTETAYPTNV